MSDSVLDGVAVEQDNHYVRVANDNWLNAKKPVTRVVHGVVKNDLWDLLEKEDFAPQSLILLEQLQTLESYLWPGFSAEESSNYQVILIALLVNIKKRQNLPAWKCFGDRPSAFPPFFRRLLSLTLDGSQPMRIRTFLLVTVTGAFQSLDHAWVRKECAPLVSISIWHNLKTDAARDLKLEQNAQVRKAWRAAAKRFDAADDATKSKIIFERSWLYMLLLDFFNNLQTTSDQSESHHMRAYSDHVVELLCDLQSQFPTRRYVNTLLQDLNTLVIIKTSVAYQDEPSGLLRDLWELLHHYTRFPIEDFTGRMLSQQEYEMAHNGRLAVLQRVALKHYKDELPLLYLSHYEALQKRDELATHLEGWEKTELKQLAELLGFRTQYPPSVKLHVSKAVLLELLLFHHEKQLHFQETVRNMAIMPTEDMLYQESFLRSSRYDGSTPLALPKLNLQYLTTGDFLWRSLILFRCEAFYEVRTYLEDTVKRMRPRILRESRQVRFEGASKMALAISKPGIVDVQPAAVGEFVPSLVKAELVLDTSRLQFDVRKQWDDLRPGEIVFLLSVNPKESSEAASPLERSVDSVRVAEIIQVQDHNGKPIRHLQDQSNGYDRRSEKRRLIVKLDARAYQKDLEHTKAGGPDVYGNLNLLVRRQSRENNFVSVLESIRRLTLSSAPMPTWLQDVFLGLGDPASASYKNLPTAIKSVDYRDTFLDWQHLVESLPGRNIQTNAASSSELVPPYIISTAANEDVQQEPSTPKRRKGQPIDDASGQPTNQIPAPGEQSTLPERTSKKRRREETAETEETPHTVHVSTYRPPNMGPYPGDAVKTNTVRFTPAQVEAIASGTQPGLTVIVGPPGTGKTDVATQIISNIYHNFPEERTLLIAHSNQALNQLFQKIAALDIDERHLLRLGHGEGDLQHDSEANYGKHGRVESYLASGSHLLADVRRLADSLNASPNFAQSCETAETFYSSTVQPLWTSYWKDVESGEKPLDEIVEAFPFHDYFSDARQTLFPSGASRETKIDIAAGCFRHIAKTFQKLQDIRPFEVLRSARERANYLLVKEARIIAMTSTHAAIRRQEIAELGFHYDNVIMEEAAQITEIENFIPMAMQKPVDGEMQLKRVVMCGDHLQNSPVVQNYALRQFANLEQSMFARLIRLGVPSIMLDQQGRARPSIAELYSWRYPGLGNLPNVESQAEFRVCNAGLQYDYQFIDVPDYKGSGEMEPTPHFFHNLGEAEYVVALFQYMRLLGYPASKISILATYAGQRNLIREILNHRCSKNRLFGRPKIVTTVDKYQGEQNDFVLLSLVRTNRVGYLRDIRRLTVALSRARLGLYIFGRRSIFESCPELKGAFTRLLQRPDKLKLVVNEFFPTQRTSEAVESSEMDGVEHLGQYVHSMANAKIASIREGRDRLPLEEARPPITNGDDEAEEDDDGGLDTALDEPEMDEGMADGVADGMADDAVEG